MLQMKDIILYEKISKTLFGPWLDPRNGPMGQKKAQNDLPRRKLKMLES